MKMKHMRKQKSMTIVMIVVAIVLYSLQILYTNFNKEPGITILGYHHIVPDEDKKTYYQHNMWVSSLSSFKAQMKLLKDQGYHSVYLQDVYEWRMGRKALDEKSVVITFDDGFYSSIAFAQPILQEYGFQGSVFVIASAIDEKRQGYLPNKRQHASSKDIAQPNETLSFYAHSFDLHQKKGGFRVDQLSKQQLREDTKKAQQHVSTQFYAYPYGKYNSMIKEVLQENKTKLAFGYNENRKAKRHDDPFALPRFNVNAYTRLDVFQQMLESE